MAETVGPLGGWAETARGDGWVRAGHPTLPMTLAVQARRTSGVCDPRGVAARLAASVADADAAARVEFRSWGRFADREVVLQVVATGAAVLFHAVWLDGPWCVVVAGSVPADSAASGGSAFADAVAELSARSFA